MRAESGNPITQLLAAAGDGDARAFEELWQLVYAELHRSAENQLRGGCDGKYIRPTELVNEAFMRMMPYREGHFENRREFFAAAAMAMRRIRIDDARKRRTEKRGKGVAASPLLEEPIAFGQNLEEVLRVGEAIDKLAKRDRLKADIVNLRYFAGFTVKETAQALGISARKVNQEWRLARAWLHRALSDGTTTVGLE
jgi:RNA polymerase sigma factor (TIGR02999 family)